MPSVSGNGLFWKAEGRDLSDKEAEELFGGEKAKLVKNKQGEYADVKTGKTLAELKQESASNVWTQADIDNAKGSAKGLERLAAQSGGSTGTFSGRVAGQIGGTSVMNRMAKAAEDTVKAVQQNTEATQNVEQAVKDNGGMPVGD